MARTKACNWTLLAGLAAGVLLAVLPRVARAAPLYESFAEVSSTGGEDNDSGGKTSIATFVFQSSVGSAGALLAPGGMYLYSHNQSPLTRGGASGTVTVEDVIFSKLPGYSAKPDTFTGTVRVRQSSSAIYGDLSASASLSAEGLPGGSDSTFIPGEDLSFPVSDLFVSEPYTLQISGSVRTTTGSPDDVFLTLVAGGSPVFDLPEGYTANSVDGMIVDGYYQGDVPEPGTLMLLAAGGAVVFWRFSRGRRRAS
jgi:hypothetical protein